MILQPIGRFQGQATDVELARKEIKNVKTELVRFMITFYYFFIRTVIIFCYKVSNLNLWLLVTRNCFFLWRGVVPIL
jgi:hypothetical protein